MEKLIVPKRLAMFFDNYYDMIGDDVASFEIIHDLMNDYNYNLFDDATREFIHLNMNVIFDVISGKIEYEEEKDEFYALIIGLENEPGTPHWAYNPSENRLSINYLSGHQEEVNKMSKDEWNKLNISNKNAIFTKELK